ncbi:hypothetical protein DY000_02021831 [Brassica cretica]|uniref:Uncharacterized protein n=1 Tax=Brassica cretica TaxID=69181 RepID=A0ABQ7E245_BRACR|nr:hypothetical protein DY000_02021831 [Brassica cretica]
MKRLLQVLGSRFLPPGSRFPPLDSRDLPPGQGPTYGFRLPASRSNGFSCLRRKRKPKEEGKTSIDRAHKFYSRQSNILTLEDLFLRHAYDRLIPTIVPDKMKSYTHRSTYTTSSTSSDRDLLPISNKTPCSPKHIDAPFSLQHAD